MGKAVTKAKARKTRGKPRKLLRNRLNDLTGSEWLFATNSLWETAYPPDASHALRKAHGAMKPPEAMRDLVKFFTKSGELVLDPFAGVGGTLLGAQMVDRRAVGIEIDPRWREVFETIRRDFGIASDGSLVARDPKPGRGNGRKPKQTPPPGSLRAIDAELLEGNCLDVMASLEEGSFDAIICDPPYGVDHGSSGFSKETNFSMAPTVEGDFGAAPSFEKFFDLMEQFADQAWRLLRPGKYLVVMIGDRYRNSRYIPMGVRTADALERNQRFVLKGIRMWVNRATLRPLRPYALGSAFVPNITHQNVVILRRAD